MRADTHTHGPHVADVSLPHVACGAARQGAPLFVAQPIDAAVLILQQLATLQAACSWGEGLGRAGRGRAGAGMGAGAGAGAGQSRQGHSEVDAGPTRHDRRPAWALCASMRACASTCMQGQREALHRIQRKSPHLPCSRAGPKYAGVQLLPGLLRSKLMRILAWCWLSHRPTSWPVCHTAAHALAHKQPQQPMHSPCRRCRWQS